LAQPVKNKHEIDNSTGHLKALKLEHVLAIYSALSSDARLSTAAANHHYDILVHDSASLTM
jgi:hypothetical protein